MMKPTRTEEESHSPIGQFAHDRGIPGVKHDYSRYLWKDGKILWRLASDKRMGQRLTPGHMEHLENLQDTLQKGGHPDSQVRVVWVNSKGEPVKYWKPGMGERQRKPINADRLKHWMQGR